MQSSQVTCAFRPVKTAGAVADGVGAGGAGRGHPADGGVGAGVDGEVVVDIWTDYRGDLLAYKAADIIVALLHLVQFTLPGSQSLLLRRERVARFTEPDGVTHHTSISFRHIATN